MDHGPSDPGAGMMAQSMGTKRKAQEEAAAAAAAASTSHAAMTEDEQMAMALALSMQVCGRAEGLDVESRYGV